MTRRTFHRAVFTAAGAYNLLWGTWSALDPQWLFRFARMTPINYPEIFACLAMVVGLYGVVYLEIARRPERGFMLALVGFIGKVLGPIGAIYLISTGKWQPAAIVMNVTNDFIWLIPFGIYLYDAWPFYQRDWDWVNNNTRTE